MTPVQVQSIPFFNYPESVSEPGSGVGGNLPGRGPEGAPVHPPTGSGPVRIPSGGVSRRGARVLGVAATPPMD